MDSASYPFGPIVLFSIVYHLDASSPMTGRRMIIENAPM